MSNISRRLPDSLHRAVRQLAQKEHVPINFLRLVVALSLTICSPAPAVAYGGQLSKLVASRVDLSDKTLSTFNAEFRDTLFRYLSGNPRWEIREERSIQYAVRLERVDGDFKTSLNGFYAIGRGDQLRQTRVLLAFRGPHGFGRERGNITRAKPGSRDVALIVEGEHSGSPGNSSYLIIEGTGLFLEIYEQAPELERTFTQAAFTEVSAELRDVVKYQAEIKRIGTMPVAARYPKPLPEKARFVVHDGMQPGMYLIEAAINPTRAGSAHIRAYNAKTGERLSEDRMTEPSTRYVGWSGEGKRFFSYGSEVTVYEGDWSHQYEARFELWHRPDSGPATKLAEATRVINGWQR